MTRAFVAVRPSHAALDELETSLGARHETLPSARWTRREQWHVTVQFLGDHADPDAVADALHGVDAKPGVAQLGGGGAFASARRASVAWVGLALGRDVLAAIAAAVGDRLRPIGYEPEARAFHPHVTVARGRRPFDARAFVAAVPAQIGPPFVVDELVVYESRTRAEGPEYLVRGRIPLG